VPIPLPKSEPPPARIPAAIDDAVGAFLPRAAGIIGLTYLALSVLYAAAGTPYGRAIFAIDVATALPVLALAFHWRRRAPSVASVPSWIAGLAGVVLANSAAGLAIHPAPQETLGLQVVAIAGGYFLISSRLFVGVLAATFAIFALGRAFGPADPGWNEALVRLVAFAATGSFFHVGRQRQIARIESLHQENVARALALDASEERFRTLAENARDMVSVLDESNCFVYVSPRSRELLGYEPQELVGANAGTIVDVLDQPAAITTGARWRSGSPDVVSLRCRRRDGSLVLHEITARPIEDAGVRRLVLISRDVTERHALEERLRVAQKHESLAVMAGGIAHDFNNLLTVMLGEAEIARFSGDVPGALGRIAEAASRAQQLTGQLLAYAGGMPRPEQTLDLAAQVEAVVELLRSSIASHSELHFDFAPGRLWVRADPGQLQQIIMNLVINASESRGGAPVHITVAVRGESLSAREASRLVPSGERSGGTFAVLEVRDDGDGIPAEHLDRIFDPFFTTKGTGHGLGLAAVLGVGRSHGAGIRVESDAGKGCTFAVYFPAREAAADARPSAIRRGNLPLGGSALLADDEPAVRRVMARSLRALGLEPLEAADGEEALAIAQGRLAELRVAVIDVSMPGLDGAETRRRLHALRADLPVLLVSGFNPPHVATAADAPGAFLCKPFSQAEFAERVRALVGGSAA
jgi:PAS domain S-box-containing protein